MSLPSNVRLLYLARGARGFGDGFATIILPAYLARSGYDPVQIGIVVTASLLGTALLTLAVGAIAPRHDLRTLMLAGASLMTLTGLALPNFDHIGFVVCVLFVGTINPSAGDIGVLIPLEHAALSHNVADEERTRAFARYSLIGALSSAAGTLSAAAPDFLIRAGIGQHLAFALMFYVYALLGVASALVYQRLPRTRAAETAPRTPLGPSRRIVLRLAALFSLDAFAGGFVAQSLMALWLFQRFDLSIAGAGVFFFWTGLLSAFSYPVAARLARHVGLVNTMVFTHIPSSVFLILAAFASDLRVVLGLLLLRSALSQMDVPTRTSYVMAVVTPAERATAASVTAVPRSLAAAVSPTFSGVLVSSAFSGLPLVLCGSLKIVYDVALLLSFRHIRPPEDLPPPSRPEDAAMRADGNDSADRACTR